VRRDPRGNFQGTHDRRAPPTIRDDRPASPASPSTKFVHPPIFLDITWTVGAMPQQCRGFEVDAR
jgi:hypothetical protein